MNNKFTSILFNQKEIYKKNLTQCLLKKIEVEEGKSYSLWDLIPNNLNYIGLTFLFLLISFLSFIYLPETYFLLNFLITKIILIPLFSISFIYFILRSIKIKHNSKSKHMKDNFHIIIDKSFENQKANDELINAFKDTYGEKPLMHIFDVEPVVLNANLIAKSNYFERKINKNKENV